MKYIIRGLNGKEYGPVDQPTLVEWVRQGRVSPDTKIRNLDNGMMLMASNMPELDGLFMINQARQATAISSGFLYMKPGANHQEDRWEDYKFVIMMCVLGILFSLILGWFALVFTILGLKRAWEASKEQKEMSGLAFGLAIMSLLATIALPFAVGFWLQRLIR